MEELIPLIAWGILIFLFSSGGAKQKKRRQQVARQARLEARRRRMEQDAAEGGLVGVAEAAEEGEAGDDAWDDAQGGDRERQASWSAPEPDAVSAPEPQPDAGDRSEPQVPRDVWELVEALARGTLSTQREPEPPTDVRREAAYDLGPQPNDESAYPTRPGRPLPVPSREVTRRAERPPPVRRSIQSIGRERSDAGISGVDAEEHAAEVDLTLSEVDAEHHSKVAAAVARARARRNAGTVPARQSLFGMSGRKGVRRAIVLSEVLGQPTSLRDGVDPHRPPE